MTTRGRHAAPDATSTNSEVDLGMVNRIADALVAAAAEARWPDGSMVIDLDESLIRTKLAPRLAEHLAVMPGCPTGGGVQ
jgi:hypothetical protein